MGYSPPNVARIATYLSAVKTRITPDRCPGWAATVDEMLACIEDLFVVARLAAGDTVVCAHRDAFDRAQRPPPIPPPQHVVAASLYRGIEEHPRDLDDPT